jgi:hypothetical protein
MVKTIALYQIPGYKTLELVVESELISSSDHYDSCPTSISENSNPVLAEEITHSRAGEQPPTCFSEYNMDEDEEEWYLNVEEYDIQDVTDIKKNS